MRHRLSCLATSSAAAVLTLALVAVLNSIPVEAAVASVRGDATGSDSRRSGSAEHAVDGPQSRIEEQLLLLSGGNFEGDAVGAGKDEEEYGREQEESISNNEVKRRWGQNNLALWGKRRLPYSDDDDSVLAIKRKWGQKNMALWGKRSGHVSDDLSAEKRKWGQKNMALWGRK